MAPLYRHRQNAKVVILGIIAVAALIAAIGGLIASPFIMLAIPLLALIGWIFSSLTVNLTARELIWYFGPGLWTYRLPVDQISAVEIVKNKWWYGWGVRMTPRR